MVKKESWSCQLIYLFILLVGENEWSSWIHAPMFHSWNMYFNNKHLDCGVWCEQEICLISEEQLLEWKNFLFQSNHLKVMGKFIYQVPSLDEQFALHH